MLGSNMNTPQKQLQIAIHLINERIGEVEEYSNVYETEPWGVENQSNYYNQALRVSTLLSPQQVLEAALIIEKLMGRQRKYRNESRVIDIDLLLYDQVVLDSQELVLPHPRMHLRNFVLIPLSEIAGREIHPTLKKSILDLRQNCKDSGKVNIVIKT